MTRFRAPRRRDGRWVVVVLIRRANGEAARFAQWFATAGQAWRFIEQSCAEIDAEVVAG